MIILQLDLLGFNFVLATGFSSIKKEFGKGFKGSAIGFKFLQLLGVFLIWKLFNNGLRECS